jgi:hypothetical protein
MPIRRVPGAELSYLLIAHDAEGRERPDDPDGRLGHRASLIVREEPVTDVFLFIHGWMGGMPEAARQYDAWTGAMARSADDLARMRDRRPGFRPLLIGLHWPSKPFGDVAMESDALAFEPADPIERLAAQTADTPAARAAQETIQDAATRGDAPVALPAPVREAYEVLDREMGMGAGGPGAAPGDDREPFDPRRDFRLAADDLSSFGGPVGDGLLAPLRTLSFWRMKDRARRFGEGGAHALLAALQREAHASGRDVRFHLMGHSFGGIVASAMVCGATGSTLPVHSLCLVQGALSLWSFAESLPHRPDHPGYFHRLRDGRVSGAILTTRSAHDRALGTWYPLAAGAARQVEFATPGALPRHGAIGTFGAQGPGVDAVDRPIGDASATYDFRPGSFTNLDASRIIRRGGGFAGAHGDIAHPEVAHAVWQAAVA